MRFAIALPALAWAASPVHQCAPLMPGHDCQNGTYFVHNNVSSAELCCELCAADGQCGAFTHKANFRTCEVKDKCVKLQTTLTPDNRTDFTFTAGLPEQLPPTPPATCVVPDKGLGYRCNGTEIGNGTILEDYGKCCDLCRNTSSCSMFSHEANTSTCHLMSTCPMKPKADGWVTGWVPPPSSGKGAQYQVGRGVYHLKGVYRCATDTQTVIFYPKPTLSLPGPFNVVVFGHGAWGQIDGMDDWMETIASVGLIVIAPFSVRNETFCHSPFARDLLHAIHVTRKHGAALHPALSSANWSRTGIVGQSGGAKYALAAASKNRTWVHALNISAAVLSGGVPHHQYSPPMPVMMTTGSLDKANHNWTLSDYFDNMTTRPKVYASLKGAFHMEPQEGERLNLLTSQFLSCHLAGVDEDCAVIYSNSSESLCNMNSYEACLVCTDAHEDCPLPPHPDVNLTSLAVEEWEEVAVV